MDNTDLNNAARAVHLLSRGTGTPPEEIIQALEGILWDGPSGDIVLEKLDRMSARGELEY